MFIRDRLRPSVPGVDTPSVTPPVAADSRRHQRDWGRSRRVGKSNAPSPLDPAQKTAGSGSMDVDEIRSSVRQSTSEEPLDTSPVAYVAKFVDTHIVGIVGSNRDQSMAHDLRNHVYLCETLAGVGVKKNRARRPIDAARPAEMVGPQQHQCTNLGFGEAMTARRWMRGNLSMQWIARVIDASLPKASGLRGIHRDAAKTCHRMFSEDVIHRIIGAVCSSRFPLLALSFPIFGT